MVIHPRVSLARASGSGSPAAVLASPKTRRLGAPLHAPGDPFDTLFLDVMGVGCAERFGRDEERTPRP